MTVREVGSTDAAAWLRQRRAIWPDGSEAEHADDITACREVRATEPHAGLVADDRAAAPVGFVELPIRPCAEGCRTNRVAYPEGPPRGAGRAQARARTRVDCGSRAVGSRAGLHRIRPDAEVADCVGAADVGQGSVFGRSCDTHEVGLLHDKRICTRRALYAASEPVDLHASAHHCMIDYRCAPLAGRPRVKRRPFLRAIVGMHTEPVNLRSRGRLSRLLDVLHVAEAWRVSPILALAVAACGPDSSVDPVQPPPETRAPTAPTNLAAASTSSSQIDLTWTNTAPDADGIALERCTGTGCSNFAEFDRVPNGRTSYANAGLTPNTMYAYRVRAYSTIGYSPYSNTAAARTPDRLEPPGGPTNLTATAVSDSAVTLSWSNSDTTAEGIRIERCVAAACPNNFTVVHTVAGNVTSYTDSAVISLTWYTYRLRAYNAAGTSATSNSVNVVTAPPTGYAPTNLVATPTSGSQINLAWVHNAVGASGYEIERCTGIGCNDFANIFILGTVATAFQDEGLSSSTAYSYRVRAFYYGTSTSYSNTASATTDTTNYTLTVVGSGTGNGSVRSSPSGISCSISAGSTSGTCSASFASGTSVTLAAIPASGHSFSGWSGACSGTGNCTVSMTQSRSVTASFTAPVQNYTLTVGGSGTGNGSVTSSPSGISCAISAGSTSGTCSAAFASGTSVTLTATPASGHSFFGWSGACSGTGSCTVSMAQSRSVTASFTAPTQSYTLTLGGSGTGTGSVTSSPSGINCSISAGSTSGTCSTSFASGTSVTLTATPASGHSFSGWSGACSGTGSCTVSMTQSRSVTASFTAPTQSYTLTVGGSGTGNGSVTSSPSGVNCSISAGSTSGTCSASFSDGTSVTLTATAASGHSFSGWSGACSGTGACTVSMTQSRSVTASFAAAAPAAPTLIAPANGATTSDDTPAFDWSAPTYAYRYELVVDNNSSFTSPEIHEASLSVSNYTSSVSLSDGTYYWRVRANNSAGTWGGWSSTWSFAVLTAERARIIVFVENGEIKIQTNVQDWIGFDTHLRKSGPVGSSVEVGNPAANACSGDVIIMSTGSFGDEVSMFLSQRLIGDWGLDIAPSTDSVLVTLRGQVIPDGGPYGNYTGGGFWVNSDMNTTKRRFPREAGCNTYSMMLGSSYVPQGQTVELNIGYDDTAFIGDYDAWIQYVEITFYGWNVP